MLHKDRKKDGTGQRQHAGARSRTISNSASSLVPLHFLHRQFAGERKNTRQNYGDAKFQRCKSHQQCWNAQMMEIQPGCNTKKRKLPHALPAIKHHNSLRRTGLSYRADKRAMCGKQNKTTTCTWIWAEILQTPRKHFLTRHAESRHVKLIGLEVEGSCSNKDSSSVRPSRGTRHRANSDGQTCCKLTCIK